MTDVEEGERTRRQMQAAVNQSVFREVNESLEKLNREFSQVIPVGDFVCRSVVAPPHGARVDGGRAS